MLLASQRTLRACFDGCLGCQCPLCCTSGIRYPPRLSRTAISIGSPLRVIIMSSSLCTVTLSLVKIEMVPSLAVFPTLIKDVGKLVNVSACSAVCDSCLNGRAVTLVALLMLPFATCTCFVEFCKMGSCANCWSASLK